MTILDMITTSRRDVTGMMMMMMMMIDDDDDYDDLEYDLCEYCIAISWGLAYATGMEGMKPKKHIQMMGRTKIIQFTYRVFPHDLP